jgi:hypothetical protein
MKQGPNGQSTWSSGISILTLGYPCLDSMLKLLGDFRESFISFYKLFFENYQDI